MDDIQERTLLEAIMSIDKTLKRLSERFCSPESVDVADDVRKRIIKVIDDYLKLYEDTLKSKAVWFYWEEGDRLHHAELMADAVLECIGYIHRHTSSSEPYPD